MLLKDPTAIKLNDIIRKHWSIENKLHWSLDEVFCEDRSRVGTGDASANLAILRHCVYNILNKTNESLFNDYTIKSISCSE